MVSALAIAAAMSTAAKPDDVAAIRALRAESNAGLAAHDAERVVAAFAPDVHSTAGSGARADGLDAVAARYRTQLGGDGSFVSGLRTPGRIAVDRAGARASEPGRWRWVVRTPASEAAYSGDYLAAWTKRDGGWRLESEPYVTTGCSGQGCGG